MADVTGRGGGVPRPYDAVTDDGTIQAARAPATARPLRTMMPRRRGSRPERHASTPSTRYSAATGKTPYNPDSTYAIVTIVKSTSLRRDGERTSAANAVRFASVASTYSE